MKYDLAIADLEAAIAAGAVGNEGENLWTLGWTYFLAGRARRRAQHVRPYAKQFPDGDYLSNSLFWAAKIHERRGNIAGRDAALHELETDLSLQLLQLPRPRHHGRADARAERSRERQRLSRRRRANSPPRTSRASMPSASWPGSASIAKRRAR